MVPLSGATGCSVFRNGNGRLFRNGNGRGWAGWAGVGGLGCRLRRFGRFGRWARYGPTSTAPRAVAKRARGRSHRSWQRQMDPTADCRRRWGAFDRQWRREGGPTRARTPRGAGFTSRRPAGPPRRVASDRQALARRLVLARRATTPQQRRDRPVHGAGCAPPRPRHVRPVQSPAPLHSRQSDKRGRTLRRPWSVARASRGQQPLGSPPADSACPFCRASRGKMSYESVDRRLNQSLCRAATIRCGLACGRSAAGPHCTPPSEGRRQFAPPCSALE
jgi:hypothetical protein